MKKLVSIFAGVLMVVALTAPSSASAHHGFPRNCGDQNTNGAGWYNLEAYNVQCSVARKVARRWTWGHREGNWNCDQNQVGSELFQNSCTRHKSGTGHQHIRFDSGS